MSILIVRGDKRARTNEAKEKAKESSKNEDIIVLDTITERGIKPTREFISKLGKKPYRSKIISGVILEANNLTMEAQNSLLKTIEEPNETSRLILTAHSEYSLLSTISSRCQKVYLEESRGETANLPKNILASDIASRLELAENLDLEEWVYYLRSRLRKSVQESETPQASLVKLVKYIRLVEKIGSHSQIANQRLSKYLTVISIPKELKSLA